MAQGACGAMVDDNTRLKDELKLFRRKLRLEKAERTATRRDRNEKMGCAKDPAVVKHTILERINVEHATCLVGIPGSGALQVIEP